MLRGALTAVKWILTGIGIYAVGDGVGTTVDNVNNTVEETKNTTFTFIAFGVFILTSIYALQKLKIIK